MKLTPWTLSLGATLVLSLSACGDDPAPEQEREVARTFSELSSFNPALGQYAALHDEWVPGMGVHWGAPGPHLTVGVGHGDAVTLVELVVPEAAGWQPWFDQAEGEPMELEGMGMVYTQHIYVADPDTVVEGQAPMPLELTMASLTAANPALAQYEALSPYVPGMGIHNGKPGPAIVVVTAESGEVNAFEIISPVDGGWFPWFDQPEGQPMALEGMGDVYTQHIYVVDPSTID